MTTPPKDPDAPARNGSRALKDEKWERFAVLMAKGDKPKNACYEIAGYTKNSGNAKRLAERPEVAARIQFLQAESAKHTIYDVAWVKDRLARHAEHLTEVIELDDGTKKPGPMFNASAGARALELVGKELGLFKERIELGGKVAVQNTELFSKMTTEERAAMRAMLLAASARTPRPANENDQAGVVPVEREESA
jgi:hypothetical protein